MHYLALGDSISIDDYTGVRGGGAASQFAGIIRATATTDLTSDGCTVGGVVDALDSVSIRPDIITLTVCGNDFIEALVALKVQGASAEAAVQKILEDFDSLCSRLQAYAVPTIVNTVYDPTDGDDILAASLDIPPVVRSAFTALNEGIRDTGARYRFLVCDLEALFRGHGPASAEPWIVSDIEPNLAGATAIAKAWAKAIGFETG